MAHRESMTTHDLWNEINPLELDERISLVDVPIFFADQDGAALVITGTSFQNDQLTLTVARNTETTTYSCGGCRGLGAHSPGCHTQPGSFWYNLAAAAKQLGDAIGANDPTASNRAYWMEARFLRRVDEIRINHEGDARD